MKRKLTTNSRLVNDVLAAYINTYKALCELINNSIQADAKNIRLTIDYTDESVLTPIPVSRIVLWDDGYGVHVNDIEDKLLDIGTANKKGGKGVGRFAAFQIGDKFTIETVGYSQDDKTWSHAILPLKSEDFRKENDVRQVDIDTVEEILEKKADTYYQITIEDLYDVESGNLEQRKKLTKNFNKNNIKDSLFETYCLKIFNGDIKIYVNDERINPKDYIIGDPERKLCDYVDKKGNLHRVEMDYIQIKGLDKIRVYLTTQNAGVHENAVCFEYAAPWLSPSIGGWLIYYYGEGITMDVLRNADLEEMDEEFSSYRQFVKEKLNEFFKGKNRKYDEFVNSLRGDTYYPFKEGNTSKSQLLAFDKLAYMVEDKYGLLEKKDKARSILYPLVKRSISNGDFEVVLKSVLKLPDKSVKQFNELLGRSELEDVIEFSDKVSKKMQDLEFIEKLTISEISKHVKERSELHKFLTKMLWIFGEQYSNNTTLLSDKNLENNIRQLSEDCMEYKASKKDDNINEAVKGNAKKNITDLFMYSERILDEEKREVLIVELKAPKVKISPKELGQARKYATQIAQSAYAPNDVNFIVLLVSSEINKEAQLEIPGKEGNPYFLMSPKHSNVSVYVMRWADLIEKSRRRLQYLSSLLKTKDVDVVEKAMKEFPEVDFGLTSTLRKKAL